MAMNIRRLWGVALAAAAMVLALSACGDDDPRPVAAERTAPRTSTPAVTASAELAPEDGYIDHLDTSGKFPVDPTGDARDAWIRTGHAACNLLKVNGDLVGARFEIAQSIADYSEQGMSEPGLVERAVVVVEAASQWLCPEVSVS